MRRPMSSRTTGRFQLVPMALAMRLLAVPGIPANRVARTGSIP